MIHLWSRLSSSSMMRHRTNGQWWISKSSCNSILLPVYKMSTNLGASSLDRFKNNGQNFQIHIPTDHHQGQHSASAATKEIFSTERIVRKNRDVMQILSKHASNDVNEEVEASPKSPTVLDLFLKSLQEKDGCQVLCKKVFKLGEKEILVSSLEK